MNPYQPIQSFDYFVGKVCTVHTRGINWKLSDAATIDYYVGIVNSVNECGICLTNVVNHKKTFIMMPAVVAIAEETVVDRDDPESVKMLEEYQERKKDIFQHNPAVVKESPAPKPQPPKERPIQQVNGSPFIDINTLSRMTRLAKQGSK